MRSVLHTVLLIGLFAVRSLSQQGPDRLFIQPPSRPEIIPPEVFADRDPVVVDPQHFKVDLQNERVRVVHLSMRGFDGTRMHEEPEVLAVCIKDCHLRLTRPDGKIQDLHMQAGDTRWIWEDTRSEKNLSREPLDMLLIEMKSKHSVQALIW